MKKYVNLTRENRNSNTINNLWVLGSVSNFVCFRLQKTQKTKLTRVRTRVWTNLGEEIHYHRFYHFLLEKYSMCSKVCWNQNLACFWTDSFERTCFWMGRRLFWTEITSAPDAVYGPFLTLTTRSLENLTTDPTPCTPDSRLVDIVRSESWRGVGGKNRQPWPGKWPIPFSGWVRWLFSVGRPVCQKDVSFPGHHMCECWFFK